MWYFVAKYSNSLHRVLFLLRFVIYLQLLSRESQKCAAEPARIRSYPMKKNRQFKNQKQKYKQRVPIVDLHERVWLVSFRRGDMQAFERVLQVYQQSIFSYLKRCQLTHIECEQLFEEIFISIYKNADHYSASEPLKPWIFKLVVSVVRDFLRKKKVGYQLKLTDVPILDEFQERRLAVRKTPLRAKFVAWFNSAISEYLSDIEFEILLLTTVEDLCLDDIALVLEIPLTTVEAHLKHARQTLLNQWLIYKEEPLFRRADYVQV